MSGRFNADSYVEVEERLQKFRKEHPGGDIRTKIINDGFAYVRATIKADGGSATGMKAIPTQGDYPIEKAETGAIGRALVNFGYSAKRTARRPSQAGGERSPSSPPASTSGPRGDREGSPGAGCPHGAPDKSGCVICRKKAS